MPDYPPGLPVWDKSGRLYTLPVDEALLEELRDWQDEWDANVTNYQRGAEGYPLAHQAWLQRGKNLLHALRDALGANYDVVPDYEDM